MDEMGDSVNPNGIPPAIRTAAAYVNGEFSWSRLEEQRFGRLIRISVEPAQPEAARFARALDVERYDATPEDVPAFIQARQKLGHADATIYCDIANVSKVIDACAAANVSVPRWWLAWWWQRPGYPNRHQLAEAANIPLFLQDPDAIWACQYAHYETWDASVVYGTRDYSR